MVKGNLASIGFLLAAVLFVIAWTVPTFAGRSRNAAFLAVAVVFFILGLAARRKSGKPPESAGG